MNPYSYKDYEEASLVKRYPDLIPRFDHSGGYAPTGSMQSDYFLGTDRNNLNFGYGRGDNGLYFYGGLHNSDKKIPSLQRDWETPIGSLGVNTGYQGISADYVPNKSTNDLLEALLLAYNRNRVLDKEYNQTKPPDPPGYPILPNW